MMKVFTVGEVAKICKVAPRSVSKWFDSGRLKGYRMPGSQDRRIPREYLIKFLKEHGMPVVESEIPNSDPVPTPVPSVGAVESRERHMYGCREAELRQAVAVVREFIDNGELGHAKSRAGIAMEKITTALNRLTDLANSSAAVT